MADEHKFRYLIPPGANFQFLSKAKLAFVFSTLCLLGTIAALFINKEVRGSYMNWTIDFKGGTELVYSFRTKGAPADAPPVKVEPNRVRKALEAGGEQGFDVSDLSWVDTAKVPCPTKEDAKRLCDKDVPTNGMMIRTPRYSAMTPEVANAVAADFVAAFQPAKGVEKATWSGERLYVRSKQPFVGVDAAAPFKKAGLELKPWSEDETKLYAHADEGTGEYNAVFAVRGIDAQLEKVLEAAMPEVDVRAVQSYGVGAKAGAQLRDDAIKSMVYALLLIALYLAFRFDIRYAPGAALATVHDAIMVIGVFAVTWSEVSLTTVAAILTVVGFSVNDTVVIFDRIRENQAKLKDKRIERIVDIALNETLVRSIMTSLTVFSVSLIMNIFGDGMVRNFAFAMNVGVIVGAYSSLFLAAPVFVWISKRWYSGPARRRAVARPDVPQAEE